VTGVVVDAAELAVVLAADAAALDASLDPVSACVEVAVVSAAVVVEVSEPLEVLAGVELASLELFAAVVSVLVDAPACFDAATVRCIVEFVCAEPVAVVRTSATVAATVVVVEPMLPSANTVPHMVASRTSAVALTRRRSTCVRRRLERSTRAASRAWRCFSWSASCGCMQSSLRLRGLISLCPRWESPERRRAAERRL
jgi:hypothetical protein